MVKKPYEKSLFYFVLSAVYVGLARVIAIRGFDLGPCSLLLLTCSITSFYIILFYTTFSVMWLLYLLPLLVGVAADRVLVLVDNDNIRQSHSIFFKSLEGCLTSISILN